MMGIRFRPPCKGLVSLFLFPSIFFSYEVFGHPMRDPRHLLWEPLT